MSKWARNRGTSLAGLADLVTVLGISILVLWIGVSESTAVPGPIRATLGFLYAFVLPGYAVTAALYPDTGGRKRWRHFGESDGSLSLVEELVLTVGLSVAVVPLSILLVNLVGVPVGPATSLGTVTTVTVAAITVAAVRRTRAGSHGGVTDPRLPVTKAYYSQLCENVTGASLWAIVAIGALLIGAGITGGALVSTQNGEAYTELSVLTVNPDTGNLTAEANPASFRASGPEPLVVAVGNHEGERKEYRVLVQLVAVGGTGGDETIQRRETVDDFAISVPDGETKRERRSININRNPESERYKLSVLLYRGNTIPDPAPSDAYREAHFWMNLTG